MILKEAAIAVKSWEKFEELPYDDGGGVWTIGWGFTYYPSGHAVKEGDPPMSMARGNEVLDMYLSETADRLYNSFPYWDKLSYLQKAALISFAYNTGYTFGDGAHDTLDHALEYDQEAVPEALMLYVKQGDKTLLGLQRRRMSEGMMWEGMSGETTYRECRDWEPDEVASAPQEKTKSGSVPKKKQLSQKVDM